MIRMMLDLVDPLSLVSYGPFIALLV